MAEVLAKSAGKTCRFKRQIQIPCSGWMLSGTGIICKSQDHACNSPNNEVTPRSSSNVKRVVWSRQVRYSYSCAHVGLKIMFCSQSVPMLPPAMPTS